MKLLVFTLLLFPFHHFSSAQPTRFTNAHRAFSAKIGIARAKFVVTGVTTEEYPALEVRLGGGVTQPLNSRVQVSAGLNVCYRAKSKSYLANGNYFGRGTLSLLLDETASKRSHCALEIPIALSILLNSNGPGLHAGIMGRFWQRNDQAGDVLRSRQEIGYIAGASKRIFSDCTIAVEFYSGLTSVPLYVNSTIYRVRNRFAQVTLEYTLKNKLKK